MLVENEKSKHKIKYSILGKEKLINQIKSNDMVYLNKFLPEKSVRDFANANKSLVFNGKMFNTSLYPFKHNPVKINKNKTNHNKAFSPLSKHENLININNVKNIIPMNNMKKFQNSNNKSLPFNKINEKENNIRSFKMNPQLSSYLTNNFLSHRILDLNINKKKLLNISSSKNNFFNKNEFIWSNKEKNNNLRKENKNLFSRIEDRSNIYKKYIQSKYEPKLQPKGKNILIEDESNDYLLKNIHSLIIKKQKTKKREKIQNSLLKSFQEKFKYSKGNNIVNKLNFQYKSNKDFIYKNPNKRKEISNTIDDIILDRENYYTFKSLNPCDHLAIKSSSYQDLNSDELLPIKSK